MAAPLESDRLLNDNNEENDNSSTESHFRKTVTLYDWWLAKSDKEFQGKTLAIAGFTSREQQALRVFSSAPITKRFDIFTLETADGVTIFIQGFINKKRTIENGFPIEVFDHFVFGFPLNWEKFGDKCLGQEVKSGMDTHSSNLHDSHGRVAELSTYQNFSGVSTSEMDNDVDNMNNDATKKNLPTSPSNADAVSSMDDETVVQEEPFSHNVVGSFKSIDDPQSSKKKKMSSSADAKIQGSTNFPSDASEGHSAPKGSNIESFNASDLTMPIGTSGIVLATRTNGSKKKQKEIKGNKDGLKGGYINCPPTSLPQNPKAVLRHMDKNEAEHDVSLSESPLVGDSSFRKESPSCFGDTVMFSTVQSGAGVNISTQSVVEQNTVNVTPTDADGSKHCSPSRSVKENKISKPLSGCSKNRQKTELSKAVGHLDGGKPKKDTHRTFLSPSKVNVSEAMLSAARRLGNISENLKSQDKNKNVTPEEGSSSRKKARKKLTYGEYVSPSTRQRKERTCIVSPESISTKRSRSGRLLLPTLHFWRNQVPVYDADRNITGIQEEVDVVKEPRGKKGGPSSK